MATTSRRKLLGEGLRIPGSLLRGGPRKVRSQPIQGQTHLTIPMGWEPTPPPLGARSRRGPAKGQSVRSSPHRGLRSMAPRTTFWRWTSGRFFVQRVIIHDVPKAKLGEKDEHPIQFSDTPSPLKRSKAVLLPSPDHPITPACIRRGTGSRSACNGAGTRRRFFNGDGEDDEFVAASQGIAHTPPPQPEGNKLRWPGRDSRGDNRYREGRWEVSRKFSNSKWNLVFISRRQKWQEEDI